MNVAFPALVLVFYVLPGIILRRGWSHTKQVASKSFVDDIALGILWACMLHAIWIGIAYLLSTPVDVKSALMHGIGQYGKDSQYLNHAIDAVQNNIWQIVLYFLSINGVAFLLGWLAHSLRKRHNVRQLGALEWFARKPLTRFPGFFCQLCLSG